MIYLLCIVIGIITSFLGSLLGLGGGILFVPIVLFIAHYHPGFAWATPQTVVGISLLAMVFTAISGSVLNHRHKLIDYRLGFYFLYGAIPGAILGALLNSKVNLDNFPLYFGVLLLFISMLFFIKPKTREHFSERAIIRDFTIHDKRYTYGIIREWCVLISFLVGIISGLFGIGGGSMMIPSMMFIFNVPAHIAVATSLFIIAFMSGTSSITHIVLGHLNWIYVLAIIPAAWVGGWFGTYVSQKLKGTTLIKVLQMGLIGLGCILIIDWLI